MGLIEWLPLAWSLEVYVAIAVIHSFCCYVKMWPVYCTLCMTLRSAGLIMLIASYIVIWQLFQLLNITSEFSISCLVLLQPNTLALLGMLMDVVLPVFSLDLLLQLKLIGWIYISIYAYRLSACMHANPYTCMHIVLSNTAACLHANYVNPRTCKAATYLTNRNHIIDQCMISVLLLLYVQASSYGHTLIEQIIDCLS